LGKIYEWHFKLNDTKFSAQRCGKKEKLRGAQLACWLSVLDKTVGEQQKTAKSSDSQLETKPIM
jgi:hypothetical protein